MTDDTNKVDRRSFMGGALGAAAGVGIAAALMQEGAQAQPPAGLPGITNAELRPSMRTPTSLYRLEADVRDCEVEGMIPADLNGAFYRVGPDAQYPLAPGNIPFDGEGHVSMFRIKNGRADYRSRFVRNERYLAQDKARRILFPMYRNPSTDDPSVRGLSRSTANTHIINHKNLLLALKEDSPPAALDLLTLETIVPNYTFDDQLPSRTFTAHPKLDSETGNMIAFGYEAEGHGSDVVSMFEITPQGKIVWNAKIQVPYVGMLHDFAVTQNHIVFYVIPLAFDEAQMARGSIHWSWDGTKPTFFGVVRRGGDGKDLRWFEGPTRSATHVMGAFDDGNRVYVDVEMSMSNPFPFMPMRDGARWDPIAGSSHITRLSVDMSRRRASGYEMEQMYPHVGALPRQDDRYNTMPYRYGFLPCPDPAASDPRQAGACYARFDHQTRQATLFNAGTTTSLAECCFAPKNADAGEGVGYLMGVATRNDQNGRADLVILDAEHLADGPVATVKLPMRAVGQIHGWWVSEAQLPASSV
jgi:carotenoid cleavage dioxygenase-like enzyme